jgi:hypothetical protein
MYSDVAQWHQIRRSIREKGTAKKQLTVTKWVPKMGDYSQDMLMRLAAFEHIRQLAAPASKRSSQPGVGTK